MILIHRVTIPAKKGGTSLTSHHACVLGWQSASPMAPAHRYEDSSTEFGPMVTRLFGIPLFKTHMLTTYTHNCNRHQTTVACRSVFMCRCSSSSAFFAAPAGKGMKLLCRTPECGRYDALLDEMGYSQTYLRFDIKFIQCSLKERRVCLQSN